MDPVLLGTLAVLALVDSTSFGTLLIPLWMLLAPRVRVPLVLLYLGTVAVCYLAVGLLLLAGVDAVRELAAGAGDVRALRWAQLVLGCGLLVGSVAVDNRSWPRRVQDGDPPAPSRAERRGRAWRDQITGAHATVRATMAVALMATLLELATMLPYLAAIGLLAASGASAPVEVAVLAGYVIVMVAPALIALAVRLAARRRMEPLLTRLDEWLTARSSSMVGWAIGIVGVLLAGNAYQALF